MVTSYNIQQWMIQLHVQTKTLPYSSPLWCIQGAQRQSTTDFERIPLGKALCNPIFLNWILWKSQYGSLWVSHKLGLESIVQRQSKVVSGQFSVGYCSNFHKIPRIPPTIRANLKARNTNVKKGRQSPGLVLGSGR